MPVQKSKNSLMARLGERGRKAHEEHRMDETTYGIINLPPGITGGVAQLVTAKWDEYRPGTRYAGKPYVLFRGIAKLPKEHNGIPVEGQGVLLIVPLCDQPDRVKADKKPRTLEDNYADLLNELRKLGVDTRELGPDDIEDALAALQEEKPHFRFSTRAWTPPKTPNNPDPSPMTFTQFDGVCEFSENEENSGVEDSTDEAGSSGGSNAFNEFSDLNSLAEKADAGDSDAQNELTVMAEKAGLSKEAANAESWAEVAALLSGESAGSEAVTEEAGEESESSEETEDAPWEPAKGDVYKYRPIDVKSKKPAKKAVEVEVVMVDKKTQTVTVKDLNTRSIYKGVKWSSLEPAV